MANAYTSAYTANSDEAPRERPEETVYGKREMNRNNFVNNFVIYIA